MSKLEKWSEKRARKKELKKCFEALDPLDPQSEDYYKVMQRISDLHKQDGVKLNANTVFNGVASVIPVIAIILYENAGNILKTRAVNWIPKVRL